MVRSDKNWNLLTFFISFDNFSIKNLKKINFFNKNWTKTIKNRVSISIFFCFAPTLTDQFACVWNCQTHCNRSNPGSQLDWVGPNPGPGGSENPSGPLKIRFSCRGTPPKVADFRRRTDFIGKKAWVFWLAVFHCSFTPGFLFSGPATRIGSKPGSESPFPR